MNLNLPNNFHRTIIFSHIPVSGNFIYENIFQIVRGNKNLDLLKIGHQEFEPIILEFNSTFFKSFFHPNPSKHNAPFEIFDIYKEIMAILSLIGNANFFSSKYYRVERDELGNDYFKPKFQQKEPKNLITLKDDFITKTYNVNTDKVAFPKNCNNFLSNYRLYI